MYALSFWFGSTRAVGPCCPNGPSDKVKVSILVGISGCRNTCAITLGLFSVSLSKNNGPFYISPWSTKLNLKDLSGTSAYIIKHSQTVSQREKVLKYYDPKSNLHTDLLMSPTSPLGLHQI